MCTTVQRTADCDFEPVTIIREKKVRRYNFNERTHNGQKYVFLKNKTPRRTVDIRINLLKPTGYVMQQQLNIQQLYALPTLYLCVLYLSENEQRLCHLQHSRDEKCLQRGTEWVFK